MEFIGLETLTIRVSGVIYTYAGAWSYRKVCLPCKSGTRKHKEASKTERLRSPLVLRQCYSSSPSLSLTMDMPGLGTKEQPTGS